MKPRLFIGSSKEKLDIAYSIQENLEHDAHCTVWTQGIFQISGTTLDNLITALENFDFAIMVFTPDDISIIRNFKFTTVRDNVIFELGLFIGRLSKEKVFFITPETEDNFHIPNDLTGIIGGTYDSKRDDGNLKAALGPFCNQVRQKIKNHILENLYDLVNESKETKKIAIDKPYAWEYLLSAELIKSRLVSINRSYNELEKGLIFQKVTSYNGEEYYKWFKDSLNDYGHLLMLIPKIFKELNNSFGPPGVSGNILEIKEAADKINLLCKELLSWEYRIQAAIPPKELQIAKERLSGWSKYIYTELNKIPNEILRVIECSKNPNSSKDELQLNLTFIAPPGMDGIFGIFESYFNDN